MENGNGMSHVTDGDEIGALVKDYRKDRLSVTWTLGQITRGVAQRFIDKVKAYARVRNTANLLIKIYLTTLFPVGLIYGFD